MYNIEESLSSNVWFVSFANVFSDPMHTWTCLRIIQFSSPSVSLFWYPIGHRSYPTGVPFGSDPDLCSKVLRVWMLHSNNQGCGDVCHLALRKNQNANHIGQEESGPPKVGSGSDGILWLVGGRAFTYPMVPHVSFQKVNLTTIFDDQTPECDQTLVEITKTHPSLYTSSRMFLWHSMTLKKRKKDPA